MRRVNTDFSVSPTNPFVEPIKSRTSMYYFIINTTFTTTNIQTLICFEILCTDWDGVWWLLTKFSRKTTSLPHLFPKDLLGSGLKPISTRRLIISGLAKTSNNGWRTAPDTISAARLKVSLKEIFATFDKCMCGCLANYYFINGH